MALLISQIGTIIFKIFSRDEISRNRGKVLEINHFLDIQREEFDELHAMTVGNTIDPDISAALN